MKVHSNDGWAVTLFPFPPESLCVPILMNVETLRAFCNSLPSVTEDIKWQKDLCFLIADKMFCVTGLDGPFTVSFKVRDEEFQEMAERPGIMPAPYVARYKWVLVEGGNTLTKKEWEHYIRQSYEMIKAKLPRKTAKALGLI